MLEGGNALQCIVGRACATSVNGIPLACRSLHLCLNSAVLRNQGRLAPWPSPRNKGEGSFAGLAIAAARRALLKTQLLCTADEAHLHKKEAGIILLVVDILWDARV
jgi:hypothetical protein